MKTSSASAILAALVAWLLSTPLIAIARFLYDYLRWGTFSSLSEELQQFMVDLASATLPAACATGITAGALLLLLWLPPRNPAVFRPLAASIIGAAGGLISLYLWAVILFSSRIVAVDDLDYLHPISLGLLHLLAISNGVIFATCHSLGMRSRRARAAFRERHA